MKIIFFLTLYNSKKTINNNTKKYFDCNPTILFKKIEFIKIIILTGNYVDFYVIVFIYIRIHNIIIMYLFLFNFISKYIIEKLMIINQYSYLMNTKLLNISNNYYFRYYIILYKSSNCLRYYLYYTFFTIHNNNNNSYLIKIGYN